MKQRFLFGASGALFLGAAGAFFLFVPLMSIATVVLLLGGLMVMYCLGFQGGNSGNNATRKHQRPSCVLSYRREKMPDNARGRRPSGGKAHPPQPEMQTRSERIRRFRGVVSMHARSVTELRNTELRTTRLRSAESRFSECSNFFAARGVLKSPVRIS